MKAIKRGACGVLLAVLLTSCNTPHVSRRNAPDTIVVRSQQEPDRLNPDLSNAVSATDVCSPMMNGLTGVDDHMRIFPDLITTLPTPENALVQREGAGMRVTYRLRSGVRFHDGKPFTSHDVWFCWKMHMDPKAMVSSRDGYDQITAVETPDPLTAIVHFKQSYAPYLQLFSVIYPAHLLEHSPDLNLDPFNRAPIGTGPFKFKEWVAGDHVGMVANPDYFKGPPKLKKLYFKFVPDDNAAFIQLANGDIDVYADFNLEQLKPAKSLPHLEIVNIPSLTYEHLAFNLQRPMFQDRRVRTALAHAINKEELSARIFKKIWPVSNSTEHPLAWSYDPKTRNAYPFAPEQSRKLLETAGWKLGPDGIRIKDGQRLSFSITSTSGRKIREQLEQVLAGYFKAVGAEMKIQNVQGGLLFAGYPTGVLQSGKYDMALFARTAGVDPFGNLSNWHSKQVPPEGQNTDWFRDAEMDQVLEQGNRELRRAERARLYWRMSEILTREAPIIPLVYWTEMHGVNRAVRNFRANPTSSRFVWNVQDWYIAEEGE